MVIRHTVVLEAGVQEVQVHPQKFWFVENSGKIPENLDKSLKIRAISLNI